MEDILTDLKESEKRILANILTALRGLRYGHIQIVVHDAAVVQIEKTERIRPEKAGEWNYQI